MENVAPSHQEVARPGRRWLRTVVGLVVLMGLAYRLREFASFRSLWLDELALYFQIKARSYGAMFRSGVGGNQGAPAAYLLLTKLAISNISSLEVGPRIVSLFAGLGAVVTTAAIAVRAFKDTFTRVVVCLLIATSPILVHYTAEGKQYMLDTFIASLVILVSLLYEAKQCTRKTLLAVGGVVVWFSHSAPLVLCACGLVLMGKEFKARRHREIYKLVGVASVWVVSFALHASTNMRSLLTNAPLYNYWGSGLAPWDRGFVEVLKWMFRAWFNFLSFVFIPASYRSGVSAVCDWWVTVWVVVLCVAMGGGLVRLWRTRSVVAPYITALFLVVFGIGICRLSPFSSRIILYLVPWVLFCHAAVVGSVLSLASSSIVRGLLAAVLFCVVGGVSLVSSARQFLTPVDRYDIKGAVAFLSRERKPEEPILMQGADSRLFSVYARQYKLTWGKLVGVRWSPTSMPVNEVRVVKAILASPTKSVWITGAFRSAQVKEVLAYLESGCCTIVKRNETPGSVAALVTRKERGSRREQRGRRGVESKP